MKHKIFTFFLALIASIGTLFAESGTCGENLTWDLTDGVLTISGTGAMDNYDLWYSSYPSWHNYRLSITSVVITDGVTTIGEQAFRDYSNLTSVNIPNSVISIGNSAFINCSGLTSVIIPNSITSIGKEAFSHCIALTSVTIPYSVTTIGNYAFGSCSALTSIDVASNNPNYCSVDGVLFNKDKTTLIQYPIGNTRTEYVIPNSVTTIGDNAFVGCSSLTSVTIPNSVITIGVAAFYECSSLTTVAIGNSVTSIGGFAFNSCSRLTSVTIPNSVTSIGDCAFWSCSGLTSITCEAATPPTCGEKVFYEVDKSIPLYVPAGSVATYKAADQWKDFGENIQAIPTTAIDQFINDISQTTNKIIKDNQIFILLGEKVYTVTGQEVR